METPVKETTWEKIRLWFLRTLFKKDLLDYKNDFESLGVSKGYKLGFNQGVQIESKISRLLSAEQATILMTGLIKDIEEYEETNSQLAT